MEMGRLEFGSARDAWGGEATAFTPLLAGAEMLDYLGDATGIGPMSLIETEHTTAGGRSLDILAETADGQRVAIENQYNTADHDHLTRGLAYAVATDSRALVVVAEDHREEFISVAEYLNDVALSSADRSIPVWLVQMRAVRRVGDSIWSPEFVVRAEPNEWEAAVRRTVSPKLRSLDDFYAKCESQQFADFARATIESWLDRPGTRESHDAQKVVGLYHVSPRQISKGTNVLQLNLTGEITVQRGYLRDSSGAFDTEESQTELDERINQHFPNAQWRGKNYYIRATANPEGVTPFLNWIGDTMTTAQEPEL
ncbi:MAG: hypothetical protein GY745_22960 [Actinomycetia bacterium]|nr:hypothetical protein [Actinomycetes bacterium]